jgi:preprotein translocase subunit SecD
MNIRNYSIALLISALPVSINASQLTEFNHSDFKAVERTHPDGETTLKIKLSKSGKAKVKKYNADHVGEKVKFQFSSTTSELTLREPIRGDSIEIGPFSEDTASAIETDFSK